MKTSINDLLTSVNPTTDQYNEQWVLPDKNQARDNSNRTVEEISKEFAEYLKNNLNTVTPPPKPVVVVYDNMDDKDNVKINEKYPMFGYASLLDEVLEEFGGVQEIMQCNWNALTDEGSVVCLMKDWRVFRYTLKQNEFVSLKHDERKSKINRECSIFEDIDDYGHWEELGGVNEENDKTTIEKKKIEEKMTTYGEKMSDALNDFFNGGVDAIQKIMSKNDGKKVSYTDSEA